MFCVYYTYILGRAVDVYTCPPHEVPYVEAAEHMAHNDCPVPLSGASSAGGARVKHWTTATPNCSQCEAIASINWDTTEKPCDLFSVGLPN